MASPRRGLFVATILVGSFLLFLVQPMVARMALPRLGGAPNVWNSAMLVYQALLLAGYAYAHWLSGFAVRRQATIHLSLLALAALSLPIALADLPPPAPGWEVLWVPLLLVATVGPVFLVVSAQAPLMQRWFAANPDAGEPWSLYAASNTGSFTGLIAYPLLAEPLLSLHAQSLAWALGYGLLFVLVALTAWSRWRAGVTVAEASTDPGERIGWKRIVLWLALSAIPSGLMLSTTTHLTTDIFAMPLLWVIPLGLYLLSFVIAFSDRRLLARGVMWVAPAIVLFAGSFAMLSRNSGTMTIALGSCLLLFVIAIALHARLYEARPGTARLTLFYFVMSAGGALGGAFTALIAPVAFDWVWEHPLLILAAAVVLPLPEIFGWRRLPDLDPGLARIAVGLLLAMVGFLAWLLYGVASEAAPGLPRMFLTVMLTGLGLLVMSWRAAFIAVLAVMMLAQGGVETIQTSLDGQRTRSYFGIYTVRDYPDANMRMLIHGTTMHGQQSTDPAHRRDTGSYYGPTSGVGLTMRATLRLFGPAARVGVVGLGTGTLACLRQPGQRWTFFEIDPAVLRYSRDGTFTYLRDCAPNASVVLGDARLDLERTSRGSFDVLAVDAFTSDAIPLHLLTSEAVGVYLNALSDDGLLLIHISNRYIELQPILAAIAKERRLDVRLRSDVPEDGKGMGQGLVPSSWVVISRTPRRIEELEQTDPSAPWEDLEPPAPRAWTDDHASILPYIRWRMLLGKL